MGCGDDYYSEADAEIADLEVGPNFNRGGAEALVLYFYGDTDNKITSNDGMYVGLEDSGSNYAEVRYGDMNDIMIEQWQEWNIELDEFAGIDLANVRKIYIGFGDRDDPEEGETGTVLFEDIGLYPIRCRPEVAWEKGSFDGDCVIDYDDLAVMAQDWLVSAKGWFTPVAPSVGPIIHYTFDESAGGSDQPTTVDNTGSWSGFDGTLGTDPCDPWWIKYGYSGSALEFDNAPEGDEGLEGDFVEFDPLNLNSNTISITAWIKRDGGQPFAPIVFTRGHDFDEVNDPNYVGLDSDTTVGLGFGSTGPDGDPAWAINNELCYHWADAESSWAWHNEIIVPDGVWRFIALTVAPDEASLFMSDGTTIVGATNYNYHEVEAFDGPMYLGWDTIDIDPLDPNAYNERHFNGDMDDIRIYDYTLTPGEVLGIAGLSGSHYLPLESWRTDADDDDDVDLKDFAKMADYWLEEILFPIQ